MNEIKIKECLHIGHFNKEDAKKRTKEALKKVSESVAEVEKLAEKNNIYVRIDTPREEEKALIKVYPFLYLFNFSMSTYWKEDEFLIEIERCFNNRINKALSEVRFIDYNAKKKTFKFGTQYNLSPSLHYLSFVADFKNDISRGDFNELHTETINKWKNGNVEIKFKNEEDHDILKTLIEWVNDETIKIINETPKEVIKSYKETYKDRCLNERFKVWDYWKNNGINTNKGINWYLINKSWL